MTMAVESVGADFSGIVGGAHVTPDPRICAAYSVDGIVPRFVVYPTSPEQVASALKCASDRGLAVIPCRNATKLSLGNTPRNYDVALCLKEMNNVWQYEPSDLTISVEPGVKFGDFQHFVGRDNLWLPLDPEGGARASIGGILGANSAGPLRHAYGSPRDMTLGMKIATAEGKVIKTGGRVVKNVAGYDLCKLLIGSYGTLGVIVEANFKLFPRPRERSSFVLPVGTLGIARDLRRRLMRSPLPLTRMVLLNEITSAAVRAGTPLEANPREPELWVEAGGSKRVLERIRRDLDAFGREVGAKIQEVRQEETESLWERVADFRIWMAELHPEAVIVKATLPVSREEELLSWAQQEAAGEGARIAWTNLSGVGIAHLALFGLKDEEGVTALAARLRKASEEHGGMLTVVHGPQAAVRRAGFFGKTGDDFAVMEKIKAAWDPTNTLSPGRLFGEA